MVGVGNLQLATGNLKPQSVAELNNQIKALLESTFINVYVEGEVSNLTYHKSGHIYFSLKDKSSVVSCVMFRGNAQYLKFRLEVGQKIVISGSVTVYTPRGNYQILCNKIEPSGVGALALAFEQLKKKLEAKGYFDSLHKKELPKYPKIILIVTSPTGAAIEDMKKVAAKRWPLAKIVLIPTLVQGEGAKEDIARSIKIADDLSIQNSKLTNAVSQSEKFPRKFKIQNLIIVGRGGGSIEDLWAFNEEIVADAVFEANTPIISAVGHESDFVISDFVADVRASTPSNAVEIALPDINEIRQYQDSLIDEFNRTFLSVISKKEQYLRLLFKSYEQNSIKSRFEFVNKSIKDLKLNFNNFFLRIINQKSNETKLLQSSFMSNHPDKKSKKGFVQLTKDGKIIDLKYIKVNDIVYLESSQTVAKSKILELKTTSL